MLSIVPKEIAQIYKLLQKALGDEHNETDQKEDIIYNIYNLTAKGT